MRTCPLLRHRLFECRSHDPCGGLFRVDPDATCELVRLRASTGIEDIRDLPDARRSEVGNFRNVESIDLPTGHWPMWSRPSDLAGILAGLPPSS